ncbi:MAG TPA: MFS transporter [Bryobacterales bacterium]|nr:MFS transporter [Bryobacterales bacterium]
MRVRTRVVGLLFLLTIVTYLDRVCIGTMAGAISRDLRLSPSQMGAVFSIFILGYVLFEIPAGWLADRFGARLLLSRIVLWWSIFTAATAFAWSYASLLAIRFLFGAGEAGAFPASSTVVLRWFPKSERGRANGLLLMGSRLGGAVAPALVIVLMQRLGWRHTFLAFAGLGLAWALVWLWWYRNRPEEHHAVSPAELAEIRADGPVPARPTLPWRRLWRSRTLWALCAMYSGYTYGLYFYLTWLPTYLRQARGMSWAGVGLAAALPLLMGAAANVAGGCWTDWLVRRLGLRWGRRIPGVCGLAAAAVLLAVAALARNNTLSVAAFALSFGAADLILAVCWATCIDLGRQNAGSIAGTMNSLGQVGGMLSPYLLGWLLEKYGSWTLPLLISAAYYAVSAALWFVIDPEDQTFAPAPEPLAHWITP